MSGFTRTGGTVVLLGLFFLASCKTTENTYIKTKNCLYENDVLVREEVKATKDGQIIDARTRSVHDFSKAFSTAYSDESKNLVYAFSVQKTKTFGEPYETVDFNLIEYYETKNGIKETVIGTRCMRMQNNKYIYFKDNRKKMVRDMGDHFPAEFEEAFVKIAADFEASLNAVAPEEEDEDEKNSSQSKNESEKIIVKSTPNQSYIVYQFAGKPFVIAGAAAWNILKCAGYACINFIGGYNAASGNVNGMLWMLPSWKKSKEKAEAAKEANKVKYYPEYHIPFTNNHIIIEKYDRDISVVAVAGEDAEIITPIERYEYDQSISVERSAAADAASTAAFAGMVGTAVTIPVSVITWVGGAATGIYAQTQTGK